jgi:hypothetical protein
MDNLQPIRRDQFLMLEALNSEVLGAAALLDSSALNGILR